MADRVDLLVCALNGDNHSEEGDEYCARMSRRRFAENIARCCIKRSVQREGAVPVVLEPVTFGSSGREQQHWNQPVQSLNRCFFVQTENSRMRRRMDVQPMISAAFASNSGSFDAMYRSRRWGFNPRLAQTRATIMCDTPSALASLDCSSAWTRPWVFSASRQESVPRSWPHLLPALGPMPGIQPPKPFCTKTPPLSVDVVWRARQLFADGMPTRPIIQHDDQPRSFHIRRWRKTR